MLKSFFSFGLTFVAVSKEHKRIVTRELGLLGLVQWTLKQATDKYNNLLDTYREGPRKLEETKGNFFELYRLKYRWWNAMEVLEAGIATVEHDQISMTM